MTDQELDMLALLMLNELNGMMAHDKLDYIKRRLKQVHERKSYDTLPNR